MRASNVFVLTRIPFQMDEFMDEFMQAIKDVFPNLLIQFEDFSTDNAFRYLNRYRYQYRVFNDDVGFQSHLFFLLYAPSLISINRSRAQAPSSCPASSTLHVSPPLLRVDLCQITGYCSSVRVLQVLVSESSYSRFSLPWV